MIPALIYLLVLPLLFLKLLELTRQWNTLLRYSVIAAKALLSILTLGTALAVAFGKADALNARGVYNNMLLNLLTVTDIFPSFLFLLFWYSGNIRLKGNRRVFPRLPLIALFLWLPLLTACLFGFFRGRFDFRLERVELVIPGLHSDLEGFTIAHISDLHLAGFYKQEKRLAALVQRINDAEPGLIVNTGDFISYGAAEFGRYDSILKKMDAPYGRFAILGNHDMGGYLPGGNQHEALTTMWLVIDMAEASGYTMLMRSNQIVRVGRARVAIIGGETDGRHPDIRHPDLSTAVRGTIDADLRILLTHDPNHWDEVVDSYPGIELTLAGHTHGMQFGILGKRLKWSPVQKNYPRWNGLYREGNMQLYVNRGLGTIGLPVRIGMPPEITLISLHKE